MAVALSRREKLTAITSTTPMWMKQMEESYEGDETVQRLITEREIGGQNSEGIEYMNGLIYKN